MVMSIQDLEERIKALQSEVEAMKKQEAEKEKKDSPWALAELGSLDAYFVNSFIDGGVLGFVERKSLRDFNAFKTEETAKGFANAFHVMIALRQCEGAGDGFVEDHQKNGWFLDRDGDCMRDLLYRADSFTLCPPFPSEDLLGNAVEVVGADNIVAAYKFLATGS